MLPREHLPVDGTEERSSLTKGSAFLKPAQEILLTCETMSRGNSISIDLISTQPLPAAHPPAEASPQAAEFKKPQCDLQTSSCPQCGLRVPEHTLPAPPPPSLSRLQGLSMHSSRRSRSSVAGSDQPAAMPSDSCFHLLLACLWCQCSMLLLGLLEACSSCLCALCSSCCHACTRWCSAIRDTPLDELNCHAHCHSVLFQSCCEPTECLEFCLECCEICHRS
uniref:myoD family inhibitor domain-containing protein-like n=1 Tax=Monopterus albus TaxID=43700 RepID=UPI0009B48733|nr:myoD family inhibitor domain-containing protein-like [Monopterus albus]